MEDRNYYLDYEDVFIVPQYSEIETRGDVNTSSNLSIAPNVKFNLDVPVITANMDTVSGAAMCIAVASKGAIGALHRAWSIQDNVAAYKQVREAGMDCFVTVGASGDYQDRFMALMVAGASKFIIDIAHGHSLLMKNALTYIKDVGTNFVRGGIYVIAGNVATPEAVRDLELWGADAVKVGIGPGAVCKTKMVTGVTFPQWSAVKQCAAVAKVPIIADGGMKEYGDIAKAIGAGATAVMSGYFFAGTVETPNWTPITPSIYRGMASKEAQAVLRAQNNTNASILPTPEGISITVSDKGHAGHIVDEIAGALRSSYSYVGAHTTEEFQARVKFGRRR